LVDLLLKSGKNLDVASIDVASIEVDLLIQFFMLLVFTIWL